MEVALKTITFSPAQALFSLLRCATAVPPAPPVPVPPPSGLDQKGYKTNVLIFNLSGGEESRFISEVESRKFRQLKIVVLWLQQEQKFGRYCYYGCYW